MAGFIESVNKRPSDGIGRRTIKTTAAFYFCHTDWRPCLFDNDSFNSSDYQGRH